MGHSFAHVYHVGDLYPAELPGIKGLAAGGRVEGCTIEVDAARVLGPIRDARLEVAEVGVGIIQSVRHGEPGASLSGLVAVM